MQVHPGRAVAVGWGVLYWICFFAFKELANYRQPVTANSQHPNDLLLSRDA
jgi:hypothetical protein